jgi:hypothetical protein
VKRGGPSHPKTLRLALHCQIPVYAAVGLLELLFHFTAQYAPAGDVGRFSDAEIEHALGWDGAAGRLIAGLRTAQYVEPSDVYRLVVHDWHEHADQAVQRALSRRGAIFITQRKPKRKVTSHCLASALAPASLARGNGNGNGSPEGKGESEGKTPPADFATWYAAYPRKRAPEDARRAWEATRLARPPLADLLRVLGLQRASPDWMRESGQFVPYPATYLRAHSWADDIGPPTVGTRPPEDLSAITVHPLAARLNARGKVEGQDGERTPD